MNIKVLFVFCFLMPIGVVKAQFQTFFGFQEAARLNVSEKEYKKDTLNFFYNYWGKKCIPQQARYFIYAAPQDNLWYFAEYILPEKRMKAEGAFSDKGLKIPEGRFNYFHPNGKLAERGMYFEGKRTGWWVKYDEEGHHTDSVLYLRDIPAGRGVVKYGNGAVKELLAMDRGANGAGSSTTYYTSGEVWTVGQYSQGMRMDSIWTAFYPDGCISFTALYKNGVMLRQQCFDTSGKEMAECVVDRKAQYPGGGEDFFRCLKSKLRFPEGYEFSNTLWAHLLFAFDIDEAGLIKNPRVIQGLHRVFDKQFLNEIYRCGKWTPRLLYNIPVIETYFVPWTFVGLE